MADDLKRAKDAIMDHFRRQGKEYLKTDDGKFFLARTLASRKDVKPFVPKGYARDVTVKEAGIAGGAINEVRKIFDALQDMNSEEALEYLNKGIRKTLNRVDKKTMVRILGETAGPERVIEAKRKIGPGELKTRFRGPLNLQSIEEIAYDTSTYGASVNPQRQTASVRSKFGPLSVRGFVDPRAEYGQVSGEYDAGRVGLFDTKLTGSGDTTGNVRGGLKLSAPTSRITDYFNRPFGKAKGGAVKRYAKGGGVRKPRLK